VRHAGRFRCPPCIAARGRDPDRVPPPGAVEVSGPNEPPTPRARADERLATIAAGVVVIGLLANVAVLELVLPMLAAKPDASIGDPGIGTIGPESCVAGMLGGCRVTRTATGIQGRGCPTAGPGSSGFLAGPTRLPR
jgi:hypothetical protein